MSQISSTAMILAAGLGLRMRPLTLDCPKPLLRVGDKTMLDAVLDKCVAVGITRAVINTHYMADKVRAHLQSRKDIEILFSHEETLLDSGGGVKKALPLLGDMPFYYINADLPWIDQGTPSLQRMADAFDATRMDALMLMMPTAHARGFSSKGDFVMDHEGRLSRRQSTPPYPFVWIGAQIIKPALFAQNPQTLFSTNLVWDEMEKNKKLFGLVHQGTCYHVGTPQDWETANRLLEKGEGWAR